jgi:hypothetical protein
MRCRRRGPHFESGSIMNLHALALKIVRENGSPDPSVLAKSLVAAVEPDDYRDVLEEMARGYIRHVIGYERHSGSVAGVGHGSSKVAGARDAWARFLAGPEFVPSLGEWVHLRDATREQVLEMAGLRFEKARENEAAGQRYKALAARMRTAKAKQVGDLDESVIADIFGPDEAAA